MWHSDLDFGLARPSFGLPADIDPDPGFRVSDVRLPKMHCRVRSKTVVMHCLSFVDRFLSLLALRHKIPLLNFKSFHSIFVNCCIVVSRHGISCYPLFSVTQAFSQWTVSTMTVE